MGYYFTKKHPPHQYEEIRSNYLYIADFILKLSPTVFQGCVDVVCTYGHTNIPNLTLTGDQTMGMARGRMTHTM